MYFKLCLSAGLSAVLVTGCAVTPLDGYGYGYNSYSSGYYPRSHGENFSLTYGSGDRGYPASSYYDYSHQYRRGNHYYADDSYEHHHDHDAYEDEDY